MTRPTPRASAVGCLVVWAAVWCLYLAIRVSGLDVRVIPGIGPVLLVSLAISVLGPVAALVLIGVSLIRRPREALSWVVLGCAVAACFAVRFIFAATKWL